MTDIASHPDDPYRIGHHGHAAGALGHGATGPASKRIVVGYGFWLFLLSDIVMFSAFFAAYAVLHESAAGGPTAVELFDWHTTAVETVCLLGASFVCGLSSVAVDARRADWFYITMGLSFLFGVGFVSLEAAEFTKLVAMGAGPTRSAFLSAFFTLVGCHGLHVTLGLMWLLTMMAQVYAKGFRADVLRRFLCFSLFWHALDIIWVALFTFVYLLGAHA